LLLHNTHTHTHTKDLLKLSLLKIFGIADFESEVKIYKFSKNTRYQTKIVGVSDLKKKTGDIRFQNYFIFAFSCRIRHFEF